MLTQSIEQMFALAQVVASAQAGEAKKQAEVRSSAEKMLVQKTRDLPVGENACVHVYVPHNSHMTKAQLHSCTQAVKCIIQASHRDLMIAMRFVILAHSCVNQAPAASSS